MLWRSLLAIWGAGIRSAFITALALATWEILDLAISGGALDEADPAAVLGTWMVSFCLAAAALLAWTLVSGPVLAVAAWKPGASAKAELILKTVRDLFRVSPDDPDRIARVCGVLAQIALFAAATYLAGMYCIENFNQPNLIAAAIACFALAGLAIGWLGGFLVRVVVARIGTLPWLRPPWYSFAAFSLGLALVGPVVVATVVRNWSTWLPGVNALHLVQLATAIAVHAVVATVLICASEQSQIPGKSGLLRTTLLGGAWLPPALVLVVLGTVAAALGPVGSSAQVRRLVLELGGQTRIWSEVVRLVTDFDGDGYTHLMGGGDCAPFAAEIAPGKLDIPDNGIDEDCFDGDLSLEHVVAGNDPEWYDGEELDTRDYNIIIIGGDGIRPDHTSLLDYHRDTTPFLKRLAERGANFQQAYTAAPYTGYSHRAMFTGMMPLSVVELGQGARDRTELPAQFATLAEYLHKRGYYTLAVDTTVRKWAPWVARGFDKYRTLRNGKAAAVSKRILAELKRRERGRPFFLWAFYYDAHHPYLIDGMEDIPSFGDSPLDEYDRRLLFWDTELARLFEGLEPYLDDTIIIIYSDHGEEVNNEEFAGHGKKVTEDNIRVPLLVIVPGGKALVLRQPVSLIDIFPTIINFVSGRDAPNPVEGKSLARQVLTGTEAVGRLVFSETYRGDVRYAVTDGRYKLKLNLTQNHVTVHDLENDPGEIKHLEDVEQSVRLKLERAVRQYVVGRRDYWRNRAQATIQMDEAPVGMDRSLATFGEYFTLLGARLEKVDRRHRFEVYYRCDKQPDVDYRATVHVLHKGTGKFRNLDHSPASMVFGTSEWQPGRIYKDVIKFPAYCGKVKDNDIWIGFHEGREALVGVSELLPTRQKKISLKAAVKMTPDP